MQGRVRGNTSRVSISAVTPGGASKDGGRDANVVRVRRSLDHKDKSKDDLKKKDDKDGEEAEAVRGRNGGVEDGGAVDSIAARLDQWETRDAQQRLEQSTEGK